jgi:enamine deaminase RidA (YjgF/YER057c/UK114 family)
MKREAINPGSVYNSVQYGFSHAIKSNGGVSIHCAGQVAWDKYYNIVGPGDLAAQAHQALQNLRQVLEAAGASPENVVRTRTFVVNYTPDYLEPLAQAFAEFYADVIPAAGTLIGVQSLALPDFLIEIEATAQID